MAVKDAVYQVDNGNGFDEIHFKTKAKQVLMANGINLEDGFLNSKNSNGYSKLPNGLIIQWGVFTSNGINANAEISPTITLPINFPNRIGSVVPFVRKCVNESGATVNVEVIIKQVTIYTAGTYAIRLKAKEYVPGGVEVGYIAIGW